MKGYVYDANGSLTERRTCSVADCSAYTTDVSYDFDPEAQLIKVTNHSPSSETTFNYTPAGERVRATGPSGDRRFYGALLETNGLQETVFYFAGPIRIAMRSAATGIRFYHHDHLGSVRLMTDSVGNGAGTYDFLPYGKKTAGAGSPDPVWDFAGHRTDPDTGLVYMNARYYDPEIGRFISADTIVPDPNNPQSLNRYSYVNNNPISNIDPSGHSAQVAQIVHIALNVVIAIALGPGGWVYNGLVILGGALSVAGVATRDPYLAAAGGIVLGFAGGYGMGFALGGGQAAIAAGVGVLGGTVGYLASPISPVSTGVQVAVGWAWTAVGMIALAVRASAMQSLRANAGQTGDLAAGLDDGPMCRESQGSVDSEVPTIDEGRATTATAIEQLYAERKILIPQRSPIYSESYSATYQKKVYEFPSSYLRDRFVSEHFGADGLLGHIDPTTGNVYIHAGIGAGAFNPLIEGGQGPFTALQNTRMTILHETYAHGVLGIVDELEADRTVLRLEGYIK